MNFFSNNIQKIIQRRFVRDAAVLQSGMIVGNIIQALAGVLIARLLQPELFGTYSIVFNLASLIFISTGLQETVTAILGQTYTTQDRVSTHEALGFFFKFTLLFALASLLIVGFLPGIAGHFYHNPMIGWYAGIIVIASVISSTFFSASSMVLQVTNRIRSLTLLSLADQGVRLGISVLLVAVGFGVFGAVLGHGLGALLISLISLLVFRIVSRRDQLLPSLRQLFQGFWNVRLKRYASFSLGVAVDKNIGGLYAILPVLLVGLYLPPAQVGFFKLSLGYINLAMSLFAPISILLNFELPKMVATQPQRVRAHFIRISLIGALLSTVITGAAILAAPVAFHILYGSSFTPSIQYVRYFWLYGTAFGIGIGLGSMWRAIQAVKISIIINVIVLSLGIPIALWLIRSSGIVGAIIAVTGWYLISHLASFIYISMLLRKR